MPPFLLQQHIKFPFYLLYSRHILQADKNRDINNSLWLFDLVAFVLSRADIAIAGAEVAQLEEDEEVSMK